MADQNSNGEPIIKISKLSTRFGEHIVHADLDLEIQRSEIFALVGGSSNTHEAMVEKAIKINEHLKRRGKELSEISRQEFDDIAHKVGLQRHAPEEN